MGIRRRSQCDLPFWIRKVSLVLDEGDAVHLALSGCALSLLAMCIPSFSLQEKAD